MKRILLWMCAVIICFQCSSAQEKSACTRNAPDVSPQDQKFVEMEKVLWEAWKTKDRKPYEDLLSDKFFEVDVTGTYDKATEISYMDKCDLKDYAILDPQVRHLNDETVLLTYEATVHDICEGQPVPEHLIINIVFVREKGKWLKVLDSEIPQPAQQVRSTQSAAGNEDDIRGAQDALIAAYIHRDIAALDRILADEYTFINDDAGGVVNKKQILDSFRSGGDREITSYTRQDDHVRWYGDVAVLTYRYHSNETYKGQDARGDFRVTRIFVKRDRRWQMVGGQETRVFGSEPSARDRLIGTWRLVSAEALRPDGSLQPFPEFGTHPIGYLMYDKTGHMCVTLANPNPLHWEDPAKPSDSERALTHKSMEAYCGTYEVREKEGRVIHRPELAEWPYYIGSDQVRNFHIEGDRLILSLEETPPNGEKRRSQITWERVSDASLPSIKTTSATTVFGSDKTQDDADIHKRLIGSWRQVSDEEILPNGTVVRPDEVGLITYDASGHMSAQVMRRSVSEAQVPSDANYLNNGYDAYFGTYTIDEVKHTITHHVEGSVARQLVGKDLVRSFQFDGEHLILKPTSADEHWTVVLEKNTGN